MIQDDSSPLKYLASFAITFVAGMLTSAGLKAYASHVEQRARKEALRGRPEENQCIADPSGAIVDQPRT